MLKRGLPRDQEVSSPRREPPFARTYSIHERTTCQSYQRTTRRHCETKKIHPSIFNREIFLQSSTSNSHLLIYSRNIHCFLFKLYYLSIYLKRVIRGDVPSRFLSSEGLLEIPEALSRLSSLFFFIQTKAHIHAQTQGTTAHTR